MAAQGSSSWDDLRKLARKLENEIDTKLMSFSKLGTTFTTKNHKSESSDTVPLLSASSGNHMLDTLTIEIEQLLEKLSDVNDKLSEYVEVQGKIAPSSTLNHTLQRHRDILKDYVHDFHKTKTNIQSLREREDLLGSVRRDIEARKGSTGLMRRSDLYLKESQHIRNSDRLVDEQISIALDTREHLINQKAAFKAIQSKINTLANRFPVINSLVQRINFRKRRDSIILGLVIGVCLILLIAYMLR